MATSRSEAAERVLKTATDQDVRFIRLWFTDILGTLKNFAITSSELEPALDRGMGFDGSSIEGFARIDESDMVAMPDPDTFVTVPWRSQEQRPVGRMFCDILMPGGQPFEGDPRYVLKRNLQRAKERGYTCNVGPELEYFYFKNAERPEGLHHTRPFPEGLDKGGYFDLIPPEFASDLRRDTILTLEEMGIAVEYSHHEVAPSQHEIDLRYTEALAMADNVMTYRVVVKEVAQKYGVYATFMPKPIFGENGSGMHVHQSLAKDGRNVFFDAKGLYNLSDTARHYIAGLLRHGPEITAVTNQWVNSYKRLVPGYEAPVYLNRVPECGPRRQPIPGFQRHASGRPRRHRERVRPAGPRRRERVRDER